MAAAAVRKRDLVEIVPIAAVVEVVVSAKEPPEAALVQKKLLVAEAAAFVAGELDWFELDHRS